MTEAEKTGAGTTANIMDRNIKRHQMTQTTPRKSRRNHNQNKEEKEIQADLDGSIFDSPLCGLGLAYYNRNERRFRD